MKPKIALSKVAFSVLDLVPVREGFSHKSAMEASLELAQLAERLHFKRFWVAEHHNAPSIVSSATALLIQYLAQGTKSIRVGSGGIMLPNHAPLVVAEQFGTLATLFPDRIDLGLGRAPGTDQITARALRRQYVETVHDFPRDIQEVQSYLSKEGTGSAVRAIPGEGTEVPIYILGSSTFSAQLAATLGLPYAFASHFAPTYLSEALRIYRENFKPSSQLAYPYVIVGANVVMADTDKQAEYLATTGNLFALNIIRNTRRPLQPPVNNIDDIWDMYEAAHVKDMRKYSFEGSAQTVKEKLEKFTEEFEPDEIIFSSYIYDTKARLRCFELLNSLKQQ
ncbi:LLM class flavin-dependent oxidoreductase [Arachidicoccus sp.]|uniref:LLM class flavin-dependent oxidoreductase n=1 Tax=Arachidicoccus sp. TaxID=1872624 RepID=UPI003D263DA7